MRNERDACAGARYRTKGARCYTLHTKHAAPFDGNEALIFDCRHCFQRFAGGGRAAVSHDAGGGACRVECVANPERAAMFNHGAHRQRVQHLGAVERQL